MRKLKLIQIKINITSFDYNYSRTGTAKDNTFLLQNFFLQIQKLGLPNANIDALLQLQEKY